MVRSYNSINDDSLDAVESDSLLDHSNKNDTNSDNSSGFNVWKYVVIFSVLAVTILSKSIKAVIFYKIIFKFYIKNVSWCRHNKLQLRLFF